ncbi:MAG: hypothetical protein IJ737_00625 [Ruminococcus sp.]|nr:hypothetical protein [Ruminococcus sp.]
MQDSDKKQEYREFIISDIHILEIFTDIEICCEGDLSDAHSEMNQMLDDMDEEDIADFCMNYYQ